MFEKIEHAIKKIFWVPFCLAFVGYFFLNEGNTGDHMNIFETIYASAALYFVNPVVDDSNALIIIAKILALIVTTDFVLNTIGSALDSVVHWFVRRHADSTAVYTDTLLGVELARTAKLGYLGTDQMSEKVENTRDHIIMFGDDEFNLGFYESHKTALTQKGKRVFIGLNHIDSTLLSSSKNGEVHYFCLDEIIARSYWKKYELFSSIKEGVPYKIAFIGGDSVTRAVFNRGYLNNIYKLRQIIEYHIWGCRFYDEKILENCKTDNDDCIVVHTRSFEDEIDQLMDMDRVIVAGDSVIEVVQNLLRANGKYEIYCCMNGNQDLTNIFFSDRVHMFGNLCELLTIENIESERVYRQAKLVNYDYDLRYRNASIDSLCENYEEELERSWSEKDGFLKGSNIARADYYWIERKNFENGVPEVDRWKLEHIRWCRYHYLNGWKYAPGEKNSVDRTHPDLVKFEELSLDDQKKDGIYNSEIKRMLKILDGC